MANSSFYSGTGTNPTDVDSITSSKTAAETAATNAATSEANAALSAISASTSATNASNSASSISGSVAAAASSATDSANSATSSATSATEAANSASSASTSATSASTSATSATSSASSAADSALDASGSATQAAASAASASTSASNAATSEVNSATSAAQAAASATTAQVAAANTAVSTVSANVAYVQSVADNISDVETVSNNVLKINTVADNVSAILAANSSSTQAVSSASDAASSATQAAASATSAATSASTATAAKDAALEALDNFDDRYLGQKASDPSLDNDGNALVAGALYFNTTDNTMKVYDGSIWVAAYASLSGALIATNNLSDVTDAATSRTNLGLGTAATTASTDYATAAQGTLADTSVQPNDSPTFGSITVTGTVDGRDVAADGTKLDGIETGATADQTGAEIKSLYEAEADTNAFTDAEKTKLSGIEALADVTDTANVTAAGALMDSEVTNLAQVKAFDSADYATAAQGALADTAVQPSDSPTFVTVNATTVDFGDWTITESGGSLYFATGGTNKMKLDASGNLDVVGSVNTNATIT